ncbi:hypothetical protein QLZ14_22970 [Cronobacter sakazakii]|nr:hypothetical protein [Cronobacter sakazakii]
MLIDHINTVFMGSVWISKIIVR